MRADGAPIRNPEQITHYHSDFKGQPLDLFTDGSRWALGDAAHGQQTASDEPGADVGLGAATEDAETSPETVYMRGKEVEVSGIAADGVWVDGLPGEMPGTPYGDPYGAAKAGDVLADDAGHAATAILVLGFAVWGIHRIWQQWNDQRRDREASLDGGN